MSLPVKLNDIIDEMEIQSDGHSYYLNRKTGEIVLVTDEHSSLAEDEEDISHYSDWEQESHVPSLSLWYAPIPKLSFNLSYIYDWTKTETFTCIPVFDG